MPVYVVEHKGKKYKVEADTPQQAAEAFGPAEKPPLGERIKGEFTGKAMKELGAGLKRAPEAFAEGAGALMLDVGKGAAQMLQAPGLRMDIEAQERRFDEAVQDRRAEAERKQPGSVAVADVAAGLIPVGAGKAKGATTLTKAMLAGAGEGAFMANLPYQQDDDRILSTALGVMFPVLTTPLFKTKQAVKNMAARLIERRSDKATKALMQEAAGAFRSPTTGEKLPGLDDYTVAQASGDSRLNRLAQQAIDTKARDVVRQQLDQRVSNVRKVIGTLTKSNIDDETRAAAIHKIVKDKGAEIQRVASAEYDKGLQALRASPEGKTVRVPLSALTDEVTKLEGDLGDILGRLRGTSTGHKLAQTIDELKRLEAGNVRELKLDGIAKLSKELNEVVPKTGGMPTDAEKEARLVSIRLRKALERSIAQSPNEPGYNALREIAGGYRKQMQELRRFRADQLTRLFGDEKVLANPEAAFDRFINLKPSAQRRGVELLGHESPETLFYFQKRYLDKVLDEAQQPGRAAMASQLDVNKLAKGLTDRRIQESPLFSAQEKKWAAAVAADLRVINNMNPDATRVGSDIPIAEVGMNVISHSPEFMTRLLLRTLTGTKFENVLFTRQGRAAVTTVKNLRTASESAKNRAAAWLIGAYLSEPVPEEEEPQQ